jgi:quercetin 2,3-dioxygenase
MPQQENGRMRGFQLWVNLPAREKMKPATYRDLQASEIPVVSPPGGGTAKVIAGTVEVDGISTVGPIKCVTTDPTYLDIVLAAGARFSHPINSEYGPFVMNTRQKIEKALRDYQSGALTRT